MSSPFALIDTLDPERPVTLHFRAIPDGSACPIRSISLHGASTRDSVSMIDLYHRYGKDVVDRLMEVVELTGGPTLHTGDLVEQVLGNAVPEGAQDVYYDFSCADCTTKTCERTTVHPSRGLLHAWQDHPAPYAAHMNATLVAATHEHMTPLYATLISDEALAACARHGMVTAASVRETARAHPNLLPAAEFDEKPLRLFAVCTEIDCVDPPAATDAETTEIGERVRNITFDSDSDDDEERVLTQQFDMSIGIGGQVDAGFFHSAATATQLDIPLDAGGEVAGLQIGFALDTDAAYVTPDEVAHLKSRDVHHTNFAQSGKIPHHVVLHPGDHLDARTPVVLRTSDASLLELTRQGVHPDAARKLNAPHLMGSFVPSLLCCDEQCCDEHGNRYIPIAETDAACPVRRVMVVPAEGLASQINFAVLHADTGHPSIVYASVFAAGAKHKGLEAALLAPFRETVESMH